MTSSDYDFHALEQNIVDVIKESQVKLGYVESAMQMFYPLSSLNHMLKTELSVPQMLEALAAFQEQVRERLGEVEVTVRGKRFSIGVPAAGVRYVHEKVQASAFLTELVALSASHGATLEQVMAVFRKYSDKVVCKKMEDAEFDLLVYFADDDPDPYWYSLHSEGDHVTYHRFLKEDYLDLYE